MRYEDASHTGAFQGSQPIANDDLDSLPAGSRSPATGNLISGEGTQSGSAGADVAAGAHVTAIAGKSGEDTSFAGGKLSVTGEHGKLSVDAAGNYTYQANGGEENVRDRFTYTLADNNGATDTGSLIVEIGKTPVVIKANAQQIVPGPDGVVTLPPGVELSDIRVVGRNLVIDMPDGTQLIIVDGAIFVPQLVLGGVEIPSTNLAALLIGQEPQPAAGETPPSSGGNFAVPPPPLDPGVPLGDLIPPTEYTYKPPEPQETFLPEDREPTIEIQPDGQPASVAAVDSVDEDGLPGRDGNLPDEPPGSDEGADGNPTNNSDTDETTAGTIIIDSPDGIDNVTINGVLVTGAIGQVIQGQYGTLTITGFSGQNILYSYTLTDNTSGDNTHDDFSVTITDDDGDQATATLTIDIIDDVPTARNDTDTTVDGVATGNVMTDASPGDVGDSDTNAADTVGADNASLTSVSGFGGSNDSTFEGGLLTVNGQFGVLTIDAQGNYTYTVNPEAGGGGTDVFTYTLTDGDGDTTQATLTITNPDLHPDLQDPPAVLLDDDALANGNPGGTGDDIDSQGTPGQLQGTGGDGDLDYFFAGSNTLPAGFTTNLVDASHMQILQGGTVVLTITLDNETGAYTVVQNNPIDHPAGSNENNLSFGIGVEVEDSDGDTNPATITINVDDDTPELHEVVAQGDVTLDETSAGSPAGFPISDTSVLPVIDFTAAFGADGAAAVNATVFGLALTGGPNSGLQTAVGDFAITLVQIDGDTIEGHYNGSNVAFIIQMNGDGTVTLTQNVPLEHLVDGGTPADYNDSLDLGGLIAATVTITDGDGDQTSAQVGIGDNLVFLDDGPNAQVDGEASLDTLVLDETTPPGTETDGDSDPVGLVSTTANFADNFVSPVDYGADGPGTVSYALALSGDDVPSGLYAVDGTDTDAGDGDGYGQGAEIVLNQSGNTITGSVGLVDYFTISIDPATGVVTFTQLDNIWHGDTGSDDDTSALMAQLGSILVQQIVTDSDGDFDVASIDVSQGVFQIEDDGPVATNDVDNIVGGGDTAVGNVITGSGTVGGVGNADDVGADQPGTITQISGFGGSDNTFSGGVLVVDGQYGQLEIDADGNYTYTRFDGAPGDVQDVFTYTLTDADGDSDTGTLTINVGDAAPVLPDPATIHLDDDVIPGANGNVPDGPGDDDPDVVGENVVNGQLNGSGGDGALTYNFTGDYTLPTGFTYNQVDADTAQVLQGATVVMTIQLNQATGAFTVTQDNPIDHPSLDGLAGDNTENNLNFSIGVEVEDADGDVEPATITINVDDDTPVLSNVQAGAGVDVDETDAGSPSGFPISDTSAGAVITATQAFGADGAAAVNSVVYGLAIVGGSPEPSGLATAIGDHAITLVAIDSDTIQGQYQDGGTQVAFTIQMNANGTVTLTQNVPLEHLDDGNTPADYNDTLDLTGLINATITITDGDGDSTSASAPIGDNLVFFDDGPDAQVNGQATLDQLVLDETRPVGQDSDSGDNSPGGLATVNANFADNFVSPVDYGGDGAGTTAYSLLLSANGIGSGLYALDNTDTDAGDGDGYGQGDEILLTQVGNTITGAVNGTTYFTISINPATGVVTFTQVNNVWHSDTGDDDDTSSLSTAAAANVQVVQTVTDSDGDFDTASINIGQGVFHIEDDGPEVLAVDNTLNIDNDATPSGTGVFDFDIGTDSPNGGNDDISVSNFNVQVNGVDASNIIFNEGVENATTASYSFSFDYDTGAGGTDTATGTLVFDKAAGTYTVELDAPIAGFTIVQTSDASTTFVEYDLDGGAPDVVVAQLGTNIFAQFTAESTNNNGTPHLLTTGGNNTAWTPGELFIADPGNPQVSNTDAGVDGNTMDTGEVLDFNLYSADPGSDTTPAVPITYATDMFMQFFQYAGDDLIVVLKLGMDTNNDGTLDTFTTRAVIVDPGDLFYDSDSATGTPYEGLVAGLGSQDALLVIESNDYNADGENWVIVGSQIITDEDGTSGSGINLIGGLGDAGASDTNGDGLFTGAEVQAFSTDTDTSGVKITSIGFVVQDTTAQSATIDFDVTITDADGDTQTESITVNVGDPVAPLVPLTTLASTSDTSDASSSSLLASDSQSEQLQKTAANSNTLTLAAAVAAAGVAESAAAAGHQDFGRSHNSGETEFAAGNAGRAIASDAGDNANHSALSNVMLASANDDSAPADSSSHSSDAAESDHSLDDSAANAAAQSSDAPAAANDQGPAQVSASASPVAPTVAMVSAEALQAAGINGEGHHHGSVEQVVAEALGQGNAPAAVDAILNALPGGNGALAALANVASPAAGGVPAWDMAGHGAFAHGADMLMNTHVAIQHHDAVQPVVNG